MSETVKVIVRARPINEKERGIGCKTCVDVNSSTREITLTNLKEPDNQKVFTFDAVYSWDSKQSTLYEESAFPLVESVADGYNGTMFAYGYPLMPFISHLACCPLFHFRFCFDFFWFQ